MDGTLTKVYRQSSSAPEVVPQHHNVYMELDTQKTSVNNGLAYHFAENAPPESFQSLHVADARTGRRICGLSVIAFCIVVASLAFVVGGLVGGSIGGAIVSKDNKSSSGIITTTISLSPSPTTVTAISSALTSSTTSSASSTATTNAAGCNASNGTTYSSAYPDSKFVVLCNTDIQATSDIGSGQQTYTLGACFDLCARHNNVTASPRCIGAVWVLSSLFNPAADSMCFLKATEGTPVGPNGQTLVGGLLL